MTLVIPPGFGEASIQLRNAGDPEPWYVTFAVDLTEAAGDFAEAAGIVGTAFVNSFLTQMNEATTLVGVNLRVGQDGSDPLSVYVPVGETGTGSSAKLPQNCALLVRKATARGGRSGKGRMYIPNVLPETAVDNVGVIDSATVTAFQDVADELLTQLTGDPGPSLPMVLLHNNSLTVDPTPTPVTALVVDSLIATQRRRLRR